MLKKWKILSSSFTFKRILQIISGAPSELNEDSKFVPLDADESIFGPPVSFQSSVNILGT